jgi:hypothetical protein
VVVKSNTVTVKVAGIGHPLPPDVLRREVHVLEDIAHYLETHNDPEGIAKVVGWLERVELQLLELASG